jgi:hypothetical protein
LRELTLTGINRDKKNFVPAFGELGQWFDAVAKSRVGNKDVIANDPADYNKMAISPIGDQCDCGGPEASQIRAAARPETPSNKPDPLGMAL